MCLYNVHRDNGESYTCVAKVYSCEIHSLSLHLWRRENTLPLSLHVKLNKTHSFRSDLRSSKFCLRIIFSSRYKKDISHVTVTIYKGNISRSPFIQKEI